MKKILFIAIAAILATSSAFADVKEEKLNYKERKALYSMTRDQLDAKVSKATKKEAKRLNKEGWKVAPGQLPMEQQLERSYMMAMQYDEQMMPKYIPGTGTSVGENYDAAKVQASALAVQALAGTISQEVAAMIENTVDNKQLTAGEAASVVKTLSNSASLIEQKIGRTIPVVEMYRVLPNGNKEVQVIIYYSGTEAKEAALNAIRTELENMNDAVRDYVRNKLAK